MISEACAELSAKIGWLISENEGPKHIPRFNATYVTANNYNGENLLVIFLSDMGGRWNEQ